MSTISVIVAPFHAGSQQIGVAQGPARLLDRGLVGKLRAIGHDVQIVHIGSVEGFEGEIGRSFEVKRRVANAVASASHKGHFPLVLAGNCNTSVGAYAGLADDDAGILWFDAHPDFDTPDETMSGYFDGMGVATLAGQAWRRLAESIPGHKPFDLNRLLYCGIRDFEPGQRAKVQTHRIKAVYGSKAAEIDFVAELAKLLDDFPERALIHLDLDCLDTSVGRANKYAAAGGLSADQLRACLLEATRRTQPLAMTIASFDPDLSDDDRIADCAVEAAVIVADAVSRSAGDSPSLV